MTTIEAVETVRAGTEHAVYEAQNLVVEYKSRGRINRALDGVSFTVANGESVGLIGESGSGKSTLLRTLLGLIPPTAGQVRYRGQDIYSLPEKARHRSLGRETALVFQDPRSSLNPKLSVGAVVRDPLHVHKVGGRKEQNTRVADLLESVGLSAELANRPVRSLSGGQLQRVALARALALEPSVIATDEPTSALDVSVQAQILNLIQNVRQHRDLAMIVVSHDIRVVRILTDRTAVMYNGEIVEAGPTRSVLENPQHDYTKKLLRCVPSMPRSDAA